MDTDRDAQLQKQTFTLLHYLHPVWNYPLRSLPHYPFQGKCGGVYAWVRSYMPTQLNLEASSIDVPAVVINFVNRRQHNCSAYATHATDVIFRLSWQDVNMTIDDPVVVDLYNGRGIKANVSDGHLEFAHTIDALSIGCVVVVDNNIDALKDIMTIMSKLTSIPLDEYNNVWHTFPQQLTTMTQPENHLRHQDAAVQAHNTSVNENATKQPWRPVVRVAADTPFYFNVSGVYIEGPIDFGGVGVQFPWETAPSRSHSHWMHVAAFDIDKHLVLQQDYDCIQDHPIAYCANQSMHAPARPAINVTWEEAVKYCATLGGRLPHDWEWQLAAQGTDNRTYPWGNVWNAINVPRIDNSTNPRPADAIAQHPGGASPYGVEDLLGNVWQMTDQSCDDAVCFNVIRGSSLYYPSVAPQSMGRWYLPSAYPLWQHNRLLSYGPELDRSPYVGFRCLYEVAAVGP
eukprot:TRINITY_DN12172_c0_g2_i2.p1 TRINITY_DN12172_c0_g2~~TRINITY_DN12172_c0_g2_i2.p1  ORF type:complete len:457 (+),score=77.14 TRINITY_DN12172_c0_g2_i2:820-2190(+)